jgi:hypothetical protein
MTERWAMRQASTAIYWHLQLFVEKLLIAAHLGLGKGDRTARIGVGRVGAWGEQETIGDLLRDPGCGHLEQDLACGFERTKLGRAGHVEALEDVI